MAASSGTAQRALTTAASSMVYDNHTVATTHQNMIYTYDSRVPYIYMYGFHYTTVLVPL